MRKYKVLIIDYEPRSVAQIERALGGDRFELEIAGDGHEGIKAFHRIQPDVTLIEAMIPKKHGFEVCQELKATAHGKTSPILIVTAVYKGRKYRHQAMHHYGANGYIEKPISDEGLAAAVRDALGVHDEPTAVQLDPALTPGATDAEDDAAGHDEAVARPQSPTGAADARAEITDPTELEILERLDILIPGDPGAGDTR